MSDTTPSHGRSKAGGELTDEILVQMAKEAEEGLDVTRLRRRPEEHSGYQREPGRNDGRS